MTIGHMTFIAMLVEHTLTYRYAPRNPHTCKAGDARNVAFHLVRIEARSGSYFPCNTHPTEKATIDNDIMLLQARVKRSKARYECCNAAPHATSSLIYTFIDRC